ncbi:MAG: ComEC/Rec2 family competence protein [Clostridiales bacterium]|nr:ComEC/Rec2 family competence protein [Clostridiales bacterium]
MKRVINVRLSLLIAVAFVLGILACYEWIFGNFYFGIIVAVIVLAACIFFAIKRHGVWKLTLVMLIFAALGFGVTRLNYYVMQKREVVEQSVTLTGRVCDYGRNTDEISYTYYLEDCVELDSGQKYSGRVKLRYGGDLQTGDVVTVTGTLNSVYPVRGEVQTFYLRHSVNYELQSASVVSQESGELKLDETIRRYIYEVTRDYMPENGGIMYALLTGDRNAIDDTVNWSFARAGITHLLAVSGLHVGFIVAVVCFALRKLRLHPLIECSILAVPLTFYAYICGFVPSIVRAIVMVVCSYVARAFFGRQDLLTSLSWAAFLILLVKPFYLFDAGFQLSFLSIFGISTLYLPIDRFLTKKNVNKHLRRFVDALSVSSACTLATLFAVAINYKEVPLLGALINLIAIPLVSVVFVLGLFGLIPWVFHYLLTAADSVLQVVVRLAGSVAQFDFAAVTFTALAVTVVIAAVLMFAVGGYINLSKRGKRFFYPILTFLLVLSIVFTFISQPSRNEIYVSYGYGNAVVAVVSEEGEGALIGDFDDYTAVEPAVAYLGKFKLKSCKLYAVHYGAATELSVGLALRQLPVDGVYSLTTEGNLSVTNMLKDYGIEVVYQYPNSIIDSSIMAQSIYDGGLIAVSVSVGNIGVCLVCGGEQQAAKVLNAKLNADIFLLQEASEAYSSARLPTLTLYQSNLNYNYGANKYGNFTIKEKGDTILLTFR